MTKVINAVKTAKFDIIDGKSSIQYWRDNSRSHDDTLCRKCGSRENIGGGHVIGHIDGDYHICIIPLCQECNNQREELPPFDVLSKDLVRIPIEQELELFKKKENQAQKHRLINAMINPAIAPTPKHKTDKEYNNMARGNTAG